MDSREWFAVGWRFSRSSLLGDSPSAFLQTGMLSPRNKNLPNERSQAGESGGASLFNRPLIDARESIKKLEAGGREAEI